MRIACKCKSTGSSSQALKTNSELDNFNEAFKTFDELISTEDLQIYQSYLTNSRSLL